MTIMPDNGPLTVGFHVNHEAIFGVESPHWRRSQTFVFARSLDGVSLSLQIVHTMMMLLTSRTRVTVRKRLEALEYCALIVPELKLFFRFKR